MASRLSIYQFTFWFFLTAPVLQGCKNTHAARERENLKNSTKAAVLAFPGAEGGGRFATGGRGGSVYQVTNLNDSGPGSLRDAVSKSNRTIVFNVSGIIHLKRTLEIKEDNITIAGQTAPGDGICIAGYTLSIEASNIIIRYIRCRLGDENKDEDDAMHATGKHTPFKLHDIIIDHCSLSWSEDEIGTFYGIRDFTLQWCILSESLYHSFHAKGNHGYGGIWGGYNASFHHNLIASNTSRNPRFCGSRYTGEPDSERVDFRNNVIYNWGNINSVYGGEGGNYNIVNNYYKPGPATPGSITQGSPQNKRNRILEYTNYYFSKDAAVYPDTLFGGKFYIAGNYVAGYPQVSADNWTYGVQQDNDYYRAQELIQKARQEQPFPHAPVSTQSAKKAYLSVLDSAGAILPKRDPVDKRIITEVRTGTATYEGATYAKLNTEGVSHPAGIIDSQKDVGGYPVYDSAPPPPDSDRDGMPDKWEKMNNLNPTDGRDRNYYTLNQYYTNLEVYLHSIK